MLHPFFFFVNRHFIPKSVEYKKIGNTCYLTLHVETQQQKK